MKMQLSFNFLAFNINCLYLNLIILHLVVRGWLFSCTRLPTLWHLSICHLLQFYIVWDIELYLHTLHNSRFVFLVTHQYRIYSVETCLPTPPTLSTFFFFQQFFFCIFNIGFALVISSSSWFCVNSRLSFDSFISVHILSKCLLAVLRLDVCYLTYNFFVSFKFL